MDITWGPPLSDLAVSAGKHGSLTCTHMLLSLLSMALSNRRRISFALSQSCSVRKPYLVHRLRQLHRFLYGIFLADLVNLGRLVMRLLDVDDFIDIAPDVVRTHIDLCQRDLSFVERNAGQESAVSNHPVMADLPSAPFLEFGSRAC